MTDMQEFLDKRNVSSCISADCTAKPIAAFWFRYYATKKLDPREGAPIPFLIEDCGVCEEHKEKVKRELLPYFAEHVLNPSLERAGKSCIDIDQSEVIFETLQ